MFKGRWKGVFHNGTDSEFPMSIPARQISSHGGWRAIKGGPCKCCKECPGRMGYYISKKKTFISEGGSNPATNLFIGCGKRGGGKNTDRGQHSAITGGASVTLLVIYRKKY